VCVATSIIGRHEGSMKAAYIMCVATSIGRHEGIRQHDEGSIHNVCSNKHREA